MADMNHTDEEEIYKLLGQDALTWLQQAEFFRMSAVPIWEKLREILDVSQVRHGIREQKLAFTQSFMLLIGPIPTFVSSAAK
jgi:hypothetical protein